MTQTNEPLRVEGFTSLGCEPYSGDGPDSYVSEVLLTVERVLPKILGQLSVQAAIGTKPHSKRFALAPSSCRVPFGSVPINLSMLIMYSIAERLSSSFGHLFWNYPFFGVVRVHDSLMESTP